MRQLMEQHDYGQKPLSRAAGLNERAVGQMLNSTDNPGVRTLEAIAQVFGMTLGELYDGDDECCSVTDGGPRSVW